MPFFLSSTVYVIARVFLFVSVTGGVMWWFHVNNLRAIENSKHTSEPCPKAESVVEAPKLEKTPELQDVPSNQEKYATAFRRHAARFDDAYARLHEDRRLAQRRRLYSIMLDAASRCMRCLYNIRMWMHNDLVMEERMRTFESICDDYFARCIRDAYALAYTPADETLIPRRWNRRWSDPLHVCGL